MTQQNDPGEERELPPAAPPDAVPIEIRASEPSQLHLPEPRAEASGKAPAPVDSKESFLKKYLRNAGKAMIVFAVLGCFFLMFAAFMLISTFNRIFDALK
jgi:hypothetical protein